MKIKVLGTQSPIANPGHNCPGFLIKSGNATILLDCGSGTHAMVKLPESLINLHIFISHLHTDHFSDVFNYQTAAYVYHKLGIISQPINIYLPETPKKDVDYITSQQSQFAEYSTLYDKKQYKIGNASISFCPTSHSVETYAIKLQENDVTLAYTADTSFEAHKHLIEFVKGADLLISEASLLEEHRSSAVNTHLTAKQAGTIAKEAGVKQLMLTHFWHNESIEKYITEAKSVFDNVIHAVEGQEILFPE